MSFVDSSSVNSPCVRNCCLNEQDVCLGCFRTLEEIKAWGGADAGQKEIILINAMKRRKEHGAAKAKRFR
ncbi:DUF1289 domain-containing protein [Litoribacillus peritrichatus]|uniref:DUF1289 domain-containing protein n=1 Tax=Litoribacillus peritrichatus TaxID=718191 RepID=UPI0031DA87C6